jgi:hypothetical protein
MDLGYGLGGYCSGGGGGVGVGGEGPPGGAGEFLRVGVSGERLVNAEKPSCFLVLFLHRLRLCFGAGIHDSMVLRSWSKGIVEWIWRRAAGQEV